MLCEKCKKNQALVKIIKNYNGNILEQYLCKECASYEDIPSLEVKTDNILSDFLNMFSPEISYNLQCENCHTTYSSFKKQGKFGCEKCYTSFGKNIDMMLKNIHSSDEHTGKLPKKYSGALRIKREKEALRKKLEALVKEEKYEEAAKIRDKIKEMEE